MPDPKLDGSDIPVCTQCAGGGVCKDGSLCPEFARADLDVSTSPVSVSAAPGWRGRWVGQEDAEGCSLAVLAMLTGETYQAVKREVAGWSDEPHDWATQGTSHHTLDRYLTRRGFWMRRHYATWDLPMVPFAPLHYAMVKQPSGRSHFVAMLSNGDVLDPVREGVFALADWPAVNQIVGVRGV